MRERRFNLIVGSPGAGKSTFVANAVKKYPGNAIIYKHMANISDPAFQSYPEKTQSNWRQGAAPGAAVKCKFAGLNEDYIEFLDWIKDYYRNGLLIIDDATIFERDRLTKEMNHLVAMRRHYGIDIWLVYHGMTLLPIEQFIFVNNIVLFNTNDNLKYKSSRLPQVDLINAKVAEARRNYRSTDPKIKYKPAILKLS